MDTFYENPFSDFGNIVRGERFIGRKEKILEINNRVIRPHEPGNLAIIGEPRIGKSSLIYKAIIEQKESLHARRVIPVWVNLATYDRAAILFRSLVTSCYDALGDLDILTDTIKKAAQVALQDELSWTEGYSRIQRFFEKVRDSGIRILFILDEFDHARNLFKGDVSGFQGLRELSYRPEWRVTFITTSRRSIRDIELQTKAISTLDGIFQKRYLAMFNRNDLDEYYHRLESAGMKVDNAVNGRINYYCGGHPYLLEMLGYEMVELLRESDSVDVDIAARRIEHSFLDQYDRMTDLLREDKSLHRILQILFGPVIDVTQADVEEFLKYGLIEESSDIKGNYKAFSQHFHSYLEMIERQIDLWPLWKETEKTLRAVITSRMLEQYGEDWVNKLERSHASLKAIFDSSREAQQKEEKTFGSRASRNLLDFTYPQDLFAIVFKEWSIFKAIFGKDKGYWEQRIQILSKVRNPLAHNRDSALYDYERKLAEGYCNEILTVLSKDEQA